MKGKVVVLGAGPAGLSAAWKLSERGMEVEVLEAERYVGGLSRTIRRDGYLFDFGPHRFHTDNPAILVEIQRLMGSMPEKPRRTRVYFMGKYYDYPLSAGNLLSSLSPWLGLACFVDFLATWELGSPTGGGSRPLGPRSSHAEDSQGLQPLPPLAIQARLPLSH